MSINLVTKRLATVKQMSQLYPAFSESSLRWLIFNQKHNGFACCVKKVGRKVVISLDEFEKFIDSQGAI